MTTTTDRKSKRTKEASEPAEQTPARTAAVLQPTKSRRRPAVIALGIALVLLGGIGVWWVTTNLTRTVSVMATSVDVSRGETITADDLTSHPARRWTTGRRRTRSRRHRPRRHHRARRSARRHTDHVRQHRRHPRGAGRLLDRGRHPHAGADVPATSSPPATRSASSRPPSPRATRPSRPPQSFDATVFTATYDNETQVWVVDLVVPNREAPDIAARAATGRVALVIDSTGE